MTILAARDGIMAADSSVWHGELSFGRAKKIIRVEFPERFGSPRSSGGLLACSGPVWAIKLVEKWAANNLNEGMRPEPLPKGENEDGFGALYLREDGMWRCEGDFHFYHDPSPFHAEGGHPEFLYGAMAAGATAEEAVRLAIEHGAWGREPIQVERL